jgi:hypothetical protein
VTLTPTAPAAETADPKTLAADEAVVGGKDGNCKAFSAHGCLFEDVATSVGSAGMLYAIELKHQSGDGSGRGAVFFFLNTTLLTNAADLSPKTASPLGSGLQYVTDAPGAVSISGPGAVSVRYVVSSGPNLCNSCVGNDGTTVYTYGYNKGLVVTSGAPPAPPAVIGEG